LLSAANRYGNIREISRHCKYVGGTKQNTT
jgi:hypothetical protein